MLPLSKSWLRNMGKLPYPVALICLSLLELSFSLFSFSCLLQWITIPQNNVLQTSDKIYAICGWEGKQIKLKKIKNVIYWWKPTLVNGVTKLTISPYIITFCLFQYWIWIWKKRRFYKPKSWKLTLTSGRHMSALHH